MDENLYEDERERYEALREAGREAEAPDGWEPEEGEDGGFEEVGL